MVQDQLQAIYRSLGNIEGKLDIFLDTQTLQEQRLTKLENFKSWLLGGVAALTLGVNLLLGWFKDGGGHQS